MGRVRIPSRKALALPFFIFIIFLAAKIPRKKQRKAATAPVLSEIHRGLQSSPAKNSLTFIPSFFRQPQTAFFFHFPSASVKQTVQRSTSVSK